MLWERAPAFYSSKNKDLSWRVAVKLILPWDGRKGDDLLSIPPAFWHACWLSRSYWNDILSGYITAAPRTLAGGLLPCNNAAWPQADLQPVDARDSWQQMEHVVSSLSAKEMIKEANEMRSLCFTSSSLKVQKKQNAQGESWLHCRVMLFTQERTGSPAPPESWALKEVLQMWSQLLLSELCHQAQLDTPRSLWVLQLQNLRRGRGMERFKIRSWQKQRFACYIPISE